MQKKIQIKIPVIDAANELLIRRLLAKESGSSEKKITGFYLTEKIAGCTIQEFPHILLTASVFINEPFQSRKLMHQDLEGCFTLLPNRYLLSVQDPPDYLPRSA